MPGVVGEAKPIGSDNAPYRANQLAPDNSIFRSAIKRSGLTISEWQKTRQIR